MAFEGDASDGDASEGDASHRDASDGALTAPMPDAEHQMFGPVAVDVLRVGSGRIKRMIYPPGLRWSVDLKPLVGTELCEHAHVGFLAAGSLEGAYSDGCTFRYVAPQIVNVEPGHDAWVDDDVPTVFVQFDFEGETTATLDLPDRHTHA